MKYDSIKKFIASLQDYKKINIIEKEQSCVCGGNVYKMNLDEKTDFICSVHYIQHFAAIAVFDCNISDSELQFCNQEDILTLKYYDTSSNKSLIIIILTDEYIKYLNEKYALLHNRKITKLPVSSDIKVAPQTITIFKQIMSYDGTGLSADMFYESKLNELISLLIHKELQKKSSSISLPINCDDISRITDVANYICTHLNEDLTNDKLASIACMSTSKLKYTFKSVFNSTIRDFKTQKRFLLACQLLKNTNQTLTEIANSIGYKKTGAFTDMFKKQAGITPGQYRKK
ncbi:MAG: AraC family transcriptional regulator [Eubacteriales bacterium]|nr:AraC family transcriptional regulator [Eubacteriales bacterium]